MTRALICLALLALAPAAAAQTPSAIEPARIELHAEAKRPTAVLLSINNAGKRPAFFLRPDPPAHWYGWSLHIDGPDGEYAFYPPPPSPWFAGSESYLLLRPGDTFTTCIELGDAKHVAQADRTLAANPGRYRVRIAYTFDAETEIVRAPQGINAVTFAQVVGGNFRLHDYGFLVAERPATLSLNVSR